MTVQQPSPLTQVQRVQLETESGRSDGRVKIRVESFDEALGWYTSGCINLDLDQLALVEQAIQTMRSSAHREETFEDNIIAFPGMSELSANAN